MFLHYFIVYTPLNFFRQFHKWYCINSCDNITNIHSKVKYDSGEELYLSYVIYFSNYTLLRRWKSKDQEGQKLIIFFLAIWCYNSGSVTELLKVMRNLRWMIFIKNPFFVLNLWKKKKQKDFSTPYNNNNGRHFYHLYIQGNDDSFPFLLY